jgi:hypothetical protein
MNALCHPHGTSETPLPCVLHIVDLGASARGPVCVYVCVCVRVCEQVCA